MKINNLPTNYKDYKYLTVREVAGEVWFYGAWRDDFEKALTQADEIEGHVVHSAVAERA